jgi:FKBP-type peptidyl-prolyl cis-trans isomerase FkpA
MYRVLEQAQGPSPTMQNEVVVNQRILNFDGSVIADTYKSGLTDRFSLKRSHPRVTRRLAANGIR